MSVANGQLLSKFQLNCKRLAVSFLERFHASRSLNFFYNLAVSGSFCEAAYCLEFLEGYKMNFEVLMYLGNFLSCPKLI